MVSINGLEFFDEVTPEQGELITGGTTRIVGGVDFFGGDIGSRIPNSSLSSCRQAVDNSSQAVFGTYNNVNGNCFLKTTNVRPVTNDATTGIIDIR